MSRPVRSIYAMGMTESNQALSLTVAVGMSGGVDSSIAAMLLKQRGHRVIGLTMQVWDGGAAISDEGFSGCYGPGEARDIEAARGMAERIGIQHHVVPLAPEYAADVLTYFRGEYRAGRTPNPCLRCNRTMKFGLLLKRARAMGVRFDRFATGHYARVERDAATGRHVLMKARDARKDQSYFLSRLSQEQLGQVLFPLGDSTKVEVKALARSLGWADAAERPESQNFVESREYSVLFEAGDCVPGPIVDTRGRELGRHAGLPRYTIGQRRGLGIGGAGDPYYVVRLDACANTVVVGRRDECLGRLLRVTDLNWIALAEAPAAPLRARTRIRQQHREAESTLSAMSAEPGKPAAVRVAFDEPQFSITPGQAAVFYDGDRVLGSGIIDLDRAFFVKEDAPAGV